MKIYSLALITGPLSLLLVPAAYADTIDNGQTVTVPGTQGSPWTNNTLWVGNTSNGTLLIHDGGIVTSTTASYIGRLAGSTGLVEVSDAGSQWKINDNLTIGYLGNGMLDISDGGVVGNTLGTIAYGAGSTGAVSVSGTGSQWNNGSLNVGYYGNGTLNINDGGVVSNTGLGIIGYNAGSAGAVEVSTGGLWDITQSLIVGRYSNGTLTISEGGVVNSATMNTATAEIAREVGSTGAVEVHDVGSQWINNGELNVGTAGDGTLSISEGGVVNNTKGYVYIGRYASGSGVVTVSDVGSQLNSSSSLYVGNYGNGALAIDRGGVVSNTTGYIGYNAGSTGLVGVSGVGSQWNSSALFVGYSGNGALNISDGGVVSNTTGSIAQNGTSGVVGVSGSGSQWNNSGSLVVGHSGSGTLNISESGVVSNTTAFVGSNAGSTGVVDVSGDGSLWNNSSTLTVGNFGNGTLTLADEAEVSASTMNLALYKDSSGTLNIGNGNLAGSLNTASITGGAGSATVNFNHTDDIDFSPLMAGKLTVNHLTGGTTRLLAANNYTGATTISAGTWQAGAANTFSAASNYRVGTAGQLDLAGYNQTIASLNNAGVVSFNGAPGAVLTVTGDYTGNDGVLNFNTVLNDDTSATDKLVVKGNTSGTTWVSVANAGGSGAATLNGIELVQVNGLSEGEFVQNGRIVAGAYDYYLARGVETNTSNWYLTSAMTPVIPIPEPEPKPEPKPEPEITPEPEKTPEPDSTTGQEPGSDTGPSTAPSTMVERPEAGSYSANLAAANNMFVTRLHDRLGETQYIDALTGEKKITSLWLRNEGGHTRSRDTNGQLSTQANRYVLQLGGDIAQWSHNDMDRFHLGVMAGYGNSKSRTESQLSGYRARGSVEGYSLGLYGTWYANKADKSGWYVDSWAQYGWFNNQVDGQDLVTEKYKSKGITASVESGYTVKVGENAAKNATYFIQPKAQVTWMGVKADDHKETNGTKVSGEGDGNIQTRLGVKAFMKGYSEQDKGKDREFQPFIEANWIHNTKDFGTTMDGITVKQGGAANIGELKVGVEGQINKKVNLWGNVAQQVGTKGYSDTTAMVGVKYNF